MISLGRVIVSDIGIGNSHEYSHIFDNCESENVQEYLMKVYAKLLEGSGIHGIGVSEAYNELVLEVKES